MTAVTFAGAINAHALPNEDRPILSGQYQEALMTRHLVSFQLGDATRIERATERDIRTEVLFHDRIVVVAGLQSRWARRRKIELASLADEAWVMPPIDTPVGALIADVFRSHGLPFPPRGLARGSVHLLCALVASGPFLGTFPGSLLRFGANLPPLKILPVELSMPPLPVGIMTLKNRTISPVAQLFIDCARDLTKPLARTGWLRP